MGICPVLPQPELDGDFYHDIHRSTVTARRVEPPLPHRVDGALIEPGSQALQHPHVADRAIRADHDFHHHVAFDAAPAAIFRVNRLDLTLDGGWRNA